MTIQIGVLSAAGRESVAARTTKDNLIITWL